MLNKNIVNLNESATLVINDKAKKLKQKGIKVYNMGLGQSPFPLPKQAVKALRTNAEANSYLPTNGLEALNNSVAKFYKNHHDLNVRPEQILVGPGSKELLFLLHLIWDGPTILPTPCWVSYGPQSRIFGKEPHLLHTRAEDEWKMDSQVLDDLASGIEGDILLVFSSPSNPTGKAYTACELQKLAGVMRKHKMLVVSDEIYSLINFYNKCPSLVKYYPEGTIISSGLSKWCAAGGWRLGTFIFPKSKLYLQKTMVVVGSESFSSVCTPIQYAAVTAFTEVDEKYVDGCKKILADLSFYAYNELDKAGLVTAEPDGGFYIFVDFTNFRGKLEDLGITDSNSLCEALLEKLSIASLSGAACERDPSELTIRLAYVNFDGATALEVIRDYDGPLNGEFLRRYCKEPVEAIDLIVEWVQNL